MEEGGTHEERESEGPLPQAQHDSPVTASALMVMCQHSLPSGFTHKTARIQHPGFVVDARRPAKTSTLIRNVCVIEKLVTLTEKQIL